MIKRHFITFGRQRHYLVGRYIQEGIIFKKDYAEVMSCYKNALEAEDIDAQVGMAELYYGGLGCRKGYNRALDRMEYYLQAIDNDGYAYYLVGEMYGQGCFVLKKTTKRNEVLFQSILQRQIWISCC
jgi:TPR repeat protein